jgi:uncharacterized membrane protein YdjX (TVP38/TMEM64 family)
MPKQNGTGAASNRQRMLNILRVAVVLALLAAVALNFRRLRNLSEADIAALTAGASSLALAVAAVWGIYCVKAFLFVIPAMLLYVSVGAAFHPLWLALAVNAGGILLELAVTYGMGVFLGGQQVNRLLSGNKGGRKLLELQNKRGFVMLFTARFVPAFPIDFTGLYFGAARIPFWKYLAASALGLLPRVALFTVFGEAARRFFPPKLLLAAAGAGLLAAGVAVLVKKLRKGKVS